jgi:transcription termination/antitermination protein NusA
MNKDLIAIFEYLEREKGIKRELIIDAIEESLRAAARKSIKGYINVNVQVNPKNGDIEVTAQKEVVDKVTIPQEEITLDNARILKEDAEIGEWIDLVITPQDFGRIAAQTARQVIAQKLRGAERDVIYEEYRHRMGELISGSVKRTIRGQTLVIDLGKVEGILPERFYPKTEKYNLGEKVLALLLEVKDTDNGGAEVILTRSHPDFVEQLFAQEVPEIADGTIVIERMVRDAGYRTKMAVRSVDPKVDPVGACVGVRGARVKNIIRELNNEKIDIMPFVDDPVEQIKIALDPVVPKKIMLDQDSNSVQLVVADEDYPTALGKRGMNARLLGQLVGMEIQIKKYSEYQIIANLERQEMALLEDPSLDEPLHLSGISSMIVDSLIASGYDTPRKLLQANTEDLLSIPGISAESCDRILEQIRKKRV